MPRNRIQWSEQEQMMADAYANIASSFSQITAYMKNHLRTVQNGGGIVTEGDMEEIFQQLSDMINKNLHNASQMRVQITTENVAPKKIVTKNANSNWASTASNGIPVQFESKQEQKIRISESELKHVITESVKKVLNEENSTIHKVKKFRTKQSNLPVEVVIDIDSNGEGEFEFSVDGGVENYCSGYLYVEDNEVVDFDGCYDLPSPVKTTLKELGIECNW